MGEKFWDRLKKAFGRSSDSESEKYAMEAFQFDGNWEFELELKAIMESNTKWGNSIGRKQRDENIRIRIVDAKTFDPDPLEEQLNTLNYIMNSQSKLIRALCAAMDVINDDYGARTGMRAWLPAKMTPKNLGEILLVKEFVVLTEHKEGYAYYECSCEYKEDLEHGLIIVMHGEDLMEYSEVGEMDYEAVYKDLGERAKAYIETNVKNQSFGEGQIHKKLPKYGKYKPWQELAMTEYFNSLFRDKKTERIKEIVERGNFDINHRLDDHERSLVDMAATNGNIELLDFLIKKGGDFSNALKKCNDQKTIAYLLKLGVSIDYETPWGGTRLYQSIKNYVSALKRGALKAQKIHNEEIRFYLSMGANPNKLNEAGEDYKTLLRKMYTEEQLATEGVELTIDRMIAENREKY